MEASKVTITPELLSTHLSKRRKIELRRQRVMELIKSKPAGAQIKLGEFAEATGMGTGNVHGLLQRMAKQGLISIEKLTPHELTYSVLDTPNVEWKTITPHYHNSVVPHESKTTVDLAMRFYWETQSDSLHEFVEWVRVRQ